jgi:hypothetical protein
LIAPLALVRLTSNVQSYLLFCLDREAIEAEQLLRGALFGTAEAVPFRMLILSVWTPCPFESLPIISLPR